MFSGLDIEWVAIAALAIAIFCALVALVQARRLSRLERRLKVLLAGAGSGAERMSLGELVASTGSRVDQAYRQIEDIRQAIGVLDATTARSVQYVGLVRYNPFQETGGDQSFALALLNGNRDGVVVSSLHSRTATRFYAKPIKRGGSPLSLSEEESKAVEQALERMPLPVQG